MSVGKFFWGRGYCTTKDEGTAHLIYYKDEGTARRDEGTARKKDEGTAQNVYLLSIIAHLR